MILPAQDDILFGYSRTAAGDWNVRAGSLTHAFGGTSHKVSRVETHPYFSYVHFDYDIALLILTDPIYIDDVITKIIPLPELNQVVPADSTGLVTGWGSITVSGIIVL